MSSIIQERCLNAQTSIIGSMLIDDRCIGDVLTTVSAEDFTGTHKTVFSCIKQLFTAGEAVDPVIVSGKLDKTYGDFLLQCIDVTPTAAHAMEYCKLLREDSRLLQLQDLGEQLRTVSDLDTARGLAAKINSLLVEQSGVEIFSAADLALDFYNRMSSKEKPEYISTGFTMLDEKTYLELGDYVGIGAEPSTGKTAFALQWAILLAKKHRVGFFSLETNKSKAADRIFANQADLPLQSIKERSFSEEDWTRIANRCSYVTGLKLEFIHAANWTAEDIVSTAVSKRHEIIFVDYLQKVAGAGRSQDRYEIVTNTSRTFHAAAQRNHMTVIALSQLSRPLKEKGKQTPPNMHSFRESGQIEQDLDLALLMYLVNPDDYRSDRRIKIGKNKEGEKGVVDLSFDGRLQKFSTSVKGAYNEMQKMARKAKAEMTQIRMEEEYAASEREGKQFEEVDEPVPF